MDMVSKVQRFFIRPLGAYSQNSQQQKRFRCSWQFSDDVLQDKHG